jgi:L-lactate dehydrogenase complex protein LldG
MSAREDIFAGIRRSLGVTGREATRISAVAHRLSMRPVGVVPVRGQGDPDMRLKTFMEEAQRVSASVVTLSAPDAVPAEVARLLAESSLQPQIRMGQDARLARLDWAAAGLSVAVGPSRGDDATGVSHAFAGVAETGSLVVLSGPDNPATLNYLPDNHIVLLSTADLHADLESVWNELRAATGGTLPRTINVITGPSRSADIEQTLLLGAHGPRRLHILVTP